MIVLNVEWWKSAIFYQIYPRSYADSSNNGIGDLQGIMGKLPYIKDLGINAIWISPFFKSPKQDFSYDISDYYKIDPEYGTMSDFEDLIEKAHSLDIKVILDLVLNHTSDQHKWFQESRNNINNPKRNWYVWREGRGRNRRSPPNNWKSILGDSAWKWDEITEQFYLHQFLPFQPDLNWRNPEVQEEMFNIFKYWLNKGADGYRLDIIHTLFEDKDFRDNPRSLRLFPSDESNSSFFQSRIHTQFLPETAEICKRMRIIADSYSPPKVLMGEATGNASIYRSLLGEDNDGIHLIFHFKLNNVKFSATTIKQTIEEMEHLLPPPAWPCLAFSNHDIKRMISRLGNNQYKARLMSLLLLTVRATPIIYYGEEIGLKQVKINNKYIQDPIASMKFFGLPLGKFFARDGCRTPMRWDSSVNAGFSSDTAVSWLPIGPEIDFLNVKSQEKDPNSMLSFFKELIRIRKANVAFTLGELKILPTNNKKSFCFQRVHNQNILKVFMNFSAKTLELEKDKENFEIIFSSIDLKELFREESKRNSLKPYEGIILKKIINAYSSSRSK